MNYIKELNAFYDWLELNELTKPAVLLWHALMHLNNKSGWQESFTVARSVIEAKTGLKKDAYYTARNNLKQNGLLDFKERGTKATVFKMTPVSSVLQTTYQTNYNDLSVKQTTNQTISQTTSQTIPQTTTETITKQKQNETKQNNVAATDSPGMVFRFYEKNMGPLVESIAGHLNILIDESSEELVHEALRRAVVANAGNKMKFAESILRSWNDQRLKTMSDVEAADKAFERKKQQQSKSYGNKPIREEVRPGWLGKPEDERVPETVPPANSQLEEEKQMMLAKLAAKKERGNEGE